MNVDLLVLDVFFVTTEGEQDVEVVWLSKQKKSALAISRRFGRFIHQNAHRRAGMNVYPSRFG